MPYTIHNHCHRFALWTAATAANTSTCRFSVAMGSALLEQAQLPLSVAALPALEDIDAAHRAWRTTLVTAAQAQGLAGFSHGIAAKLINIYCKTMFVCGGHAENPVVARLHPPVDSLLLDRLYRLDIGGLAQQVWKPARDQRWTRLSSTQYEAVIAGMVQACAGQPLWTMEQHWAGHR